MKLRPMSEAPLNKWLIVQHKDGHYDTFLMQSRADFVDGWVGFYELPELLHAAETMAAITPEGCKFASAFCKYPSAVRPTVEVTFNRIAPPVEYRYEAEEKPRKPRPGDWIYAEREGGWHLVNEENMWTARFCYRRVEVKR